MQYSEDEKEHSTGGMASSGRSSEIFQRHPGQERSGSAPPKLDSSSLFLYQEYDAFTDTFAPFRPAKPSGGSGASSPARSPSPSQLQSRSPGKPKVGGGGSPERRISPASAFKEKYFSRVWMEV
jgi:hypothetical protein